MTSPTRLILVARALRGLADGCVSVLLPAYLLALGYAPVEVGAIATATLLGSAALTLAVGFYGATFGRRALLLAASVLMTLTGLGFATVGAFWPLVVIAFVGTLNPSAGDVSVFLPLEHAALADATRDERRTKLFSVYALTGALSAAFGTLIAAVPDAVPALQGPLVRYHMGFLLYAALGAGAALFYRRLPRLTVSSKQEAHEALGPSKSFVVQIAGLFCIDSFAGGVAAPSIIALWLYAHFHLTVGTVAHIFFAMQLLTAVSYMLAARIAARIGLVNTMVFSHIPANLCLIGMPFMPSLTGAIALLLLRGLLSQMDVPTRTSYVMAIVTPPERPAAASLTAVPRTLAAAIGPTLGGLLLAVGGGGLPFIAGGVLKIIYDLALLAMFRHRKPPEETGLSQAGGAR